MSIRSEVFRNLGWVTAPALAERGEDLGLPPVRAEVLHEIVDSVDVITRATPPAFTNYCAQVSR